MEILALFEHLEHDLGSATAANLVACINSSGGDRSRRQMRKLQPRPSTAPPLRWHIPFEDDVEGGGATEVFAALMADV
eukprot:SAG11_NODE_2099_length_3827_cov_1.669796_1_plen_78_part_00